MAKGKKGVDGVDKVVDLFPKSSHKVVERLLKRAREKEARLAGRNASKAARELGKLLGGGRGRGTGLGAELAKALRFRGDAKGRASIRRKAPDTGGRPFHFAHSVVRKADAPSRASGPRGGSGAGTAGAAAVTGAGAAGAGGKAGRAAAHMRYIEREMAVERTYGQRLDGPEADAARDAARGPGRGAGVEGAEVGRDPSSGHATTASAGQAYVEDPAKLANGEMITFSFGTIGDRFEDRVRFWEALEEAEAHPSARVQHRLIVELPHEASPKARFEMVRRFCERFEGDGVPYWAALHAPGEGNDSRNFHAHIVYSERPAKRMRDPGAPDGPPVWDFEVTRTYKKKSRNVVTTRPHRQEKVRAYNGRDFIKGLRADFKDVVNDVLRREGVRDGKGQEVLYDARSYRDMGVDVVPMRAINRIVADKVRGGKATVLDGEYTRRMVAAELREAASKRQRDVLELVALDDAMRAATAGAGVGTARGAAAALPRELRPSGNSGVPRALLRSAGERLMRARHEALNVDVMERATVASLERVIAATTPAAVATAAATRDPKARAEAPDAAAARLLHAAATEELGETRAAAARARKTTRYRVGAAVNEWRDLVRAPPTTLSPATRRVLSELDERGDRGAVGRDGGTRPDAARARGDDAAAREAPGPRSTAREGGPSKGAAAGDGGTSRPSGYGSLGGVPGPTAGATAAKGPAPTREGEGGRRDPGAGSPAPSAGRPAAGAASSPTVDDGRGVRGTPRPTPEATPARGGDGASSQPGPGRGLPAAAPARARSGELAPPFPGMPSLPTSPDLAAVSATVSGWIKAIADNVEGAEARMAAVDELYEQLKARKRLERSARAPSPGPAARTACGVPAPHAAPLPSSPAPVGPSSPVASPPAEGAAAARDGVSQTGRAVLDGERRAPPGSSAEAGASGPSGPAPVSDEASDDARRLRVREAELDARRKRRRQAVLARRSRGRSR